MPLLHLLLVDGDWARAYRIPEVSALACGGKPGITMCEKILIVLEVNNDGRPEGTKHCNRFA